MNYLYNGVELPSLPVVDGCSYAVIFFGQDINATPIRVLLMLNQPMTIGTANMMISGGGLVSGYEIVGDANEWQHISVTDTSNGDIIRCGRLITAMPGGWSNFDLYNKNGTLHFAASEPVPVPVPVSTLDPKSLLMGWLVGRQVASQRK